MQQPSEAVHRAQDSSLQCSLSPAFTVLQLTLLGHKVSPVLQGTSPLASSCSAHMSLQGYVHPWQHTQSSDNQRCQLPSVPPSMCWERGGGKLSTVGSGSGYTRVALALLL